MANLHINILVEKWTDRLKESEREREREGERERGVEGRGEERFIYI